MKEYNGFIKFYRNFLTWEWYDDLNTKSLFLHILLKVNYQEKKWRGITIKKGQFVTSIRKLSVELGISERSIRTSLNRLKTTHEITYKTTSQYSMIMLNNWDKWQTNCTTNDTPPTQERHTSDTQVTTTKEYNKKDNKEKNIYVITQKNDLKFFLKEYEKVFLRVPFLSEEMKDKILQILGNNPLLKDKLPEIFKTLRNTEFKFKDGKRKPDIVWLLKDNNFYKIANGEINDKQSQTSISKEQRIADMQRMHEEEKRNNR